MLDFKFMLNEKAYLMVDNYVANGAIIGIKASIKLQSTTIYYEVSYHDRITQSQHSALFSDDRLFKTKGELLKHLLHDDLEEGK